MKGLWELKNHSWYADFWDKGKFMSAMIGSWQEKFCGVFKEQMSDKLYSQDEQLIDTRKQSILEEKFHLHGEMLIPRFVTSDYDQHKNYKSFQFS